MHPSPPAPRLRARPDHDAPRFVRRTKGRSYQARVWLGVDAGGSLNLGLFTVNEHETWELARWAAARAAREFVRRFDGSNLCAVLDELRRRRWIPEGVLPKYVSPTAGGAAFTARCRLVRGAVRVAVALPEPRATAEAAHAAFLAHLAREVLAGRADATADEVERLVRLFGSGASVLAAARAVGVREPTARRVRWAARRAGLVPGAPADGAART